MYGAHGVILRASEVLGLLDSRLASLISLCIGVRLGIFVPSIFMVTVQFLFFYYHIISRSLVNAHVDDWLNPESVVPFVQDHGRHAVLVGLSRV